MAPILEETDTQVIEDELESLESKFKDVSREGSKHLEKLAALMKHKKTFDDLAEKLANVYPSIEVSLAGIDEESFGQDAELDKENSDNLKEMRSDLLGQERRLKDIGSAADKLEAGLDS